MKQNKPIFHTFDNGVKLNVEKNNKPNWYNERYKVINLHEPIEELFFKATFNTNKIRTYVNIGACMGYYCILAKLISPNTNVYAVELEEFEFNRLNENCEHNNVDIKIPFHTSDEEYLRHLEEEFVPRALAFGLEYIFWEFGYDATQGEYGDKGLTRDCHLKLARVIKRVADRVCHGRLIVILCGGSGRALATYTIPRIIHCLAGVDIEP